MFVQTTRVDFVCSRSTTDCMSAGWSRSWRDCVWQVNGLAISRHPVPSPLCWMYLWTTMYPLCAPVPQAPCPLTASSSKNPHTALNVATNPIYPQSEERMGRRGTMRSPCCPCLTEGTGLMNEGGHLWGMAMGEWGERAVLTVYMADRAGKRATRRSAYTFPHSGEAEPLWLRYLIPRGRRARPRPVGVLSKWMDTHKMVKKWKEDKLYHPRSVKSPLWPFPRPSTHWVNKKQHLLWLSFNFKLKFQGLL